MQLKDNYTAADVTIPLTFAKESIPVSYKLTTACGCVVAEGVSEGDSITFSASDLTLWNAEHPYLYTLTLSTDGETNSANASVSVKSASKIPLYT